jgi:hypothetical protein
MATCTRCEATAASLTPCEGERLCRTCTTAYLTEAVSNVQAAHYGERYRYTPAAELPVTPRAWRYR